MPLVKCPDCGREVSDAAPACLGCGRPTSRTTSAPGGLLRSHASGWVAVFGALAAGFLIYWFEIRPELGGVADEPAPEPAPPPPEPPAAPEPPPESVSMDELLRAMERGGNGHRVRIMADVYKHLPNAGDCGAVMIRPAGDPMSPWRCDKSCSFSFDAFPLRTMTIDATVQHLGLVDCRPAGR